ncbi:MAG: DUF2336 domain-containing protein [Parvularculaceae bacterium]|nr:DUF2336 domain-containing protein [Parvularculaceae bacterium]
MPTHPGAAKAEGVSRLKLLIDVAREGSTEKRADLLREITDVFMAAPDRYTSSEMQHFDVILSKVTESVEIALRAEIAEKLADVANAPRNLVRQLALDEITVAQPILERSAALSEDDLIKVVQQRTQDHMKAISRRREIPASLSAELVERGDKDVLVMLASNQGAQFTGDTMTKLVEHSRAIADLQTPLTERYDLPPHLLTQMYFFVSSALKREILKRSDLLDPALIDQAIEGNRVKILKQAIDEAGAEVGDARRFIESKIRAKQLNETLLKDLIEHRRSTEFLLAFAHFVGVDPSTAQRIFSDKSFESLAIACRAAGLERSTFAKFVFGLQKGIEDQQKSLRVLDLYLKVPQEAAERVMRFWRVRSEAVATDRPKPQGIHALADRAAARR